MTETLSNPTFKAIQQLQTGIDLDGFRQVGHFMVVNPSGLASGEYFLTNLNGNLAGSRRTVQIVENAVTGAQKFRAKGAGGWGAWADRASGGGGGSTAADIVYTDAGDIFGNGVTTTVQDSLDVLAAAYANIPATPSRVFNVVTYGALPEGGTGAAATNRTAFEAAIVAAEAAGGGIIYAPRGTYYISYGGSASVGGVRLRNNMHLVGDGMGITTIKCADIGNNDLAGLVRTQSGVENSNIVVRDLTIDGNKAGQTGWANIICYFAGVTPDDRVNMDRDIWCVNVECKNGKNGTTGSANLSRGYGFDPHEVVDRFVALNCIAHDCERDGFVLDGVLNFILTGCRSYSNGRYGLNLITQSYNGIITGSSFYNNTGNNVMVQGDSHRMLFSNCQIRGAGEQGLRIRRGATIVDTYVTVDGCLIETSQRHGINVTGANYNVFTNNVLLNNSQFSDNTYMDIDYDEDDGDTGITTGAKYNIAHGNYAIARLTNKTKYGYREDLTGLNPPSDNRWLWNTAIGQNTGKYSPMASTDTIQDEGYVVKYDATAFGVSTANTDNGTALRDLVDLVSAAGGGTIILPPGTIRAGGTGTASQGVISLPSNVSLRGAGRDVTLLSCIDPVANSITGIVRTLSGAVNNSITVSDLTITSDDPTGVGDVTGMYLGGTSTNDFLGVNLTIKNARNGTSNLGYGFRATVSAARTRLVNVICQDNERDGFYWDSVVSPALMDSCRALNNTRHGIYAVDSTDLQINNPVVTGSGTNGINIENCSSVTINGGLVETSVQDNIRIRGNASVATAQYNRVKNTISRMAGRDGVSLAGAVKCEVEGCLLLDNGQTTTDAYHDVSIEANGAVNSADNYIANNRMLATQTNKTKYGVSEETSQDGTLALWNIFSGQVTASTNLVGASSRRIDNTTGSTPAGSTSEFQYNSAGTMAGSAGLTYDVANVRAQAVNPIEFKAVTSPGASPASSILLSGRARGTGIVFPSFSDPGGKRRDLQTRFGGRNISFMNPINLGGTTVSLHGLNHAAGTTVADVITTATSRTGDASTKIGTIRRVGYVGGSSPNNGCLYGQTSGNFITRGSASGVGGFLLSFLVVIAARSANSRGFFGLTALSGITAAANSQAATGTIANGIDLFGVGWDATDANLAIYNNDNASTATRTDLGSNFTVADARALEVMISAAPNASSIEYYVREITSGNEASGSISSNLPRNNIFIGPQFSMFNGGDATAMAFDMGAIYLENEF